MFKEIGAVHRIMSTTHITILDIPINLIKGPRFITLVDIVAVYETTPTTHINIIQIPILLRDIECVCVCGCS